MEDVQKKAAAKFVATELVEKSLLDKGCISYDLYESTSVDNHLVIIETWESEDALREHMESEHFKDLVPKLQKIATMTMEKFNF